MTDAELIAVIHDHHDHPRQSHVMIELADRLEAANTRNEALIRDVNTLGAAYAEANADAERCGEALRSLYKDEPTGEVMQEWRDALAAHDARVKP